MRGAIALIALVLLPVVAAVLTVASYVFLDAIGRSSGSLELFARVYVAWLLACAIGPLVLVPGLRRWLMATRWAQILIALFVLGVAVALADPFNTMRAEEGLIRYWTAGVLCVAAVIAFVASFDGRRPALDRLIGVSFGAALLLGAADEIFELHERLGDGLDALVAGFGSTSGQDLVLLGLAIAGVATVVIVVLLWRYVPGLREAATRTTYRRAFVFFTLAVVAFAAAMLLDSFDWILQDATDRVEEALGAVDAAWLAGGHVVQAANSVEEVLEYLAALLFLMMVGSFFSVRALGWAQAPGPEREASRVAGVSDT